MTLFQHIRVQKRKRNKTHHQQLDEAVNSGVHKRRMPILGAAFGRAVWFLSILT